MFPIVLHGHLERRVSEEFQSNAVGTKNIAVGGLIPLNLVSRGLPFRLRGRQIFQTKPT